MAPSFRAVFVFLSLLSFFLHPGSAHANALKPSAQATLGDATVFLRLVTKDIDDPDLAIPYLQTDGFRQAKRVKVGEMVRLAGLIDLPAGRKSLRSLRCNSRFEFPNGKGFDLGKGGPCSHSGQRAVDGKLETRKVDFVLVFDPGDPLGEYVFELTVRDRQINREVTLRASVWLVE